MNRTVKMTLGQTLIVLGAWAGCSAMVLGPLARADDGSGASENNVPLPIARAQVGTGPYATPQSEGDGASASGEAAGAARARSGDAGQGTTGAAGQGTTGAAGQAGSTGTMPGGPGGPEPEGPAMGAEFAPSSETAPNAAAAEAFAPAFSPAAGGFASGAASAFTMIGDQAPIFGRPPLPPSPHQPSGSPLNPSVVARSKTLIPYLRATKFSDNQSPIPQDRVFSNFNYFNNVNYAFNQRFQAPVHGIEVYRYLLGFEKTFLGGNASFGMSESINNLSARSPYPALGGTSTAMGDVNLFTKFILYQRWEDNSGMPALGGYGYPAQLGGAGRNGGLISGGLALTLPTGPGNFAGASFSKSFRDTGIQPWLGYFYSRGNLYLHGFESIAAATDPNDVTMLFNDFGVGYYVYRNPRLDTFLTAVAPTAEIHVNVPLNHSDFFNLKDIAGTQTVVDFTLGTNFQFGQRTVLMLGAIAPASGPRPFSVEAVALLNVYFGGRRAPRPTIVGQ